MSSLNSHLGTRQEELLQTFVLEIFYHIDSVTCNVTGCKPAELSDTDVGQYGEFGEYGVLIDAQALS